MPMICKLTWDLRTNKLTRIKMMVFYFLASSTLQNLIKISLPSFLKKGGKILIRRDMTMISWRSQTWYLVMVWCNKRRLNKRTQMNRSKKRAKISQRKQVRRLSLSPNLVNSSQIKRSRNLRERPRKRSVRRRRRKVVTIRSQLRMRTTDEIETWLIYRATFWNFKLRLTSYLH